MRLAEINQLLRSYQTQLAGVLHRTALRAGLEGMRQLAGQLPELPRPSAVRHVLRAYVPKLRKLAPAELQAFAALFPPSYQEELRKLAPKLAPHLPPAVPPAPQPPPESRLVHEAALALRGKGVLTKPEYDRLDAQAKQQAFTVAAQTTQGAVQKIQELLVKQVAEGPEKKGFVKQWTQALGESPLGPAHMETVFRTEVQKSYAEGLQRMLAHPLVDELFPYIARHAIHDDRLSDFCRIASQSGIGKSNVFRRDDPQWRKLKPPSHCNCRCGQQPLTIEQAAALGIREAIRWQKTGQPPAVPDHVAEPKLPRGSERARQAVGSF